MIRYSTVIMLMVSSAGCMHDTKPETQPPPVVAAPAAPKRPQVSKALATAAKAAPPAKRQAAAQPAKAPATKPQATPQKPQPATPPKQAAAAPTLDLDALEARLKQTKAIGLMTKLSLKNKVDDLLDEFRQHHAGKPMPTVAQLRRSYDLLMMKVLSLLQDRDQQLASDILSSRERIWGLLADPKSFAALQAG
jgi:hypothetical protein